MTDKQQEAEQPAEAALPIQTVTGWKKTLDQTIQRVLRIKVIRTTLAVMDTAGQAGAPLFAAALAFSTLFAVVPLLLLFAGVLGWLIQDSAQRSALLEQLVDYLPPLADVLSGSLEGVVRERGTLSIVGLIGLLWGSSSYYAALDEVMRRIFPGGSVRSFISQRLRGIATVLVLVGLMVSMLLLSSIFAILSDVVGDVTIWVILAPLVALGVMVVVVLAIYLLVPAAPPSWRAALPPAIAAGIGIGVLTNLFGLLAPWLIGGMLAFGVIATVFGALVWLSLSYQILLYGAAWARLRRDSQIRRGIAAAASTPYAS